MSALGDIAILIPVLYSLAQTYPDEIFFVLIKKRFADIFALKPENLRIILFDAEGKDKGFWGLVRFVFSLFRCRFDQIVDLHDVLRSRVIDFSFKIRGKRVILFEKGRKEKKALTRKKDKRFLPLKTTLRRYKDAFERAGYKFDIKFRTLFDYGEKRMENILPVTGLKDRKWLGIAPFSAHRGKAYPLEKIVNIIEKLKEEKLKIFLFGGEKEGEKLRGIAAGNENVVSVAGKFSLSEEISLMSCLDAMLSMDSGNMHLASLAGTKVVSIWGATHPYAGFYGFRQKTENALQKDLDCRPCSVFGEKPCFRKDYACLDIAPDSIVEKIIKILANGPETEEY